MVQNADDLYCFHAELVSAISPLNRNWMATPMAKDGDFLLAREQQVWCPDTSALSPTSLFILTEILVPALWGGCTS